MNPSKPLNPKPPRVWRKRLVVALLVFVAICILVSTVDTVTATGVTLVSLAWAIILKAKVPKNVRIVLCITIALFNFAVFKAVSSYNRYFTQFDSVKVAAKNQAEQNIAEVQAKLEEYYSVNKKYPQSLKQAGIQKTVLEASSPNAEITPHARYGTSSMQDNANYLNVLEPSCFYAISVDVITRTFGEMSYSEVFTIAKNRCTAVGNLRADEISVDLKD